MNRREILNGVLGLFIAQSVKAQPARKQEGMFAGKSREEGVRPEQILIVYNSSSSPEAAAATELQRYIHRMTGRLPDRVDEAKSLIHPNRRVAFLVGRTAKTAELMRTGQLEEPARNHMEAYRVTALPPSAGQGLALIGGTGIATLYAVYHYLERCCGTGFFWDGDHVPRRSLIPVAGVDISACPRFSERYYGNGCLWFYSVSWWGWEEWQRYIDWMLKSRFNILNMGYSPGVNAVWRKVWKKFGIRLDAGPPAPYDLGGHYDSGNGGVNSVSKEISSRQEAWLDWREEMLRKITQYARSRGMRVVGPMFSGNVPQGFSKAFPQARVLTTEWAGLPSQQYLHPDDPMYLKIGRVFLEEYIADYGTDRFYLLANSGELQVKEPKEERWSFAERLPLANFKVVEAIDPKGIGILEGWTFLGKGWTPERLQATLQALPPERTRVIDFWGEQQPLYKEMDYFFGKSWYFGVINSFGGDTYLHGNMALLERQFREAAADQPEDHGIGFALLNEVSGFNYFCFQFICSLGWNPDETDLTSFTSDYAVRRYGERAAPMMQKALEELLVSVYGNDDFSQPLYWHRLGSRFHSNVYNGIAFIPHLRRAVEYALKASEAASANRFYQHDLNDITRAYLHQLFNARVMEMLAALRRLDEHLFEEKAASAEQILGTIEEVLSYDPHYWLTPLIRRAQSLPGASPNAGRRVREIYTLAFSGHMRDYACRDTYEMVRSYYRPRVEAYIAGLRRELRDRQRSTEYQPEEAIVANRYDEIERNWVEHGFTLVDLKPAPERVVSVARRLLAQSHRPRKT